MTPKVYQLAPDNKFYMLSRFSGRPDGPDDRPHTYGNGYILGYERRERQAFGLHSGLYMVMRYY